MEVVPQPAGGAVGDRSLAELASGTWNDVLWAVALAKLPGVSYLDAPLCRFTTAGHRAVISVGVDLGGTSFEAASQLATRDWSWPPAVGSSRRRWDGEAGQPA